MTRPSKKLTVPERASRRCSARTTRTSKHLESLFDVRIRTQGHELLIDGDWRRARDSVGARRRAARRADARGLQAVERRREDGGGSRRAGSRRSTLRDHFLKGSLTPAGKRRVAPKSINQRRYLDAIDSHDIVFGVGPAGTGKTYLAMAQAVSFLVAKKVTPHHPGAAGRRGGREARLPAGRSAGEGQSVPAPALRRAVRHARRRARRAATSSAGTIEIAPIAFMRGRTLNDSFVILDEAQNTTSEQMKMFLTRLGFGSKAVITGRRHADRSAAGPHVGARRSDARSSAVSRGSRSSTSTSATSSATSWCSRSSRRTRRTRTARRASRRRAAAMRAVEPPRMIASWSVTTRQRDGPRRAAGLRPWLERRGAGCAATGGRQRRARERRAHRARSIARYRRKDACDRRAEFPRRPPDVRPEADVSQRPRPLTVPEVQRSPAWRHRHCHAGWRGVRRVRPGIAERRNCGSWRFMACCTCSATITTADDGAHGEDRATAAAEGRLREGPHRADARR